MGLCCSLEETFKMSSRLQCCSCHMLNELVLSSQCFDFLVLVQNIVGQ